MWVMQVKVRDQSSDQMVWKSVKASNGSEPYRYDTEAEATSMLRICYPDQFSFSSHTVRVIEEHKAV